MRNFGYMEKGSSGSLYDLKLWLRIFKNSRGYEIAIAAAVMLSLGVTGATLSLPYLMKMGIDSYITATELSFAERVNGLGGLGLSISLLIGGGFLLTFTQAVLLEWVGQSVMHRIRQQLFKHILDLDLAFLNNQPTGRLVTRLTNDVQNMYEMFTSVMITLFNDILRLVGILVVLYLMNVKLALVMSLFVPLALALTVGFSRLAREKFREIRSQLSKINSFIQESVSGISIIQLFGRQERWNRKFEDLSREYLNRTLRQIRLFAAFMPLTEMMSWAAVSLIIVYGGYQVIERSLSIGELIAFIAYMRLFFQPLRELAQKYSIVQSALASAERIFDMLDTRNKITAPPNPTQLTSPDGSIAFDRISFEYHPGQPVIRQLSLTIAPGETVAVVGPTGSGKSTLINLLLRFYEPQQGVIRIDGIDIAELSIEQLRTVVGVILQDVFILDDTFIQNIVMDSGRSRSDVEKIIERLGMSSFIATLADGLDTRIGDGGRELSSGEKQLLAFARAFCRDPAVLVLDEATAFVDSETESILERAIEEVTERTSIIIAHRLSTIKRADRIVVMENGRIVEQGSHVQLIRAGGAYAELIRLDTFKEI
ncbi:MAG: ABC transporter ATP-binding protein [Desulfofustis sp.]|jgi:ATP-binding cassette subfamily B multidrug efflux pump